VVTFEKAKALRLAAQAPGNAADSLRLNQLCRDPSFELTVRLDSTNQYAAVELTKSL